MGLETPCVEPPDSAPDQEPLPFAEEGSGQKVCTRCAKVNPATADVCRQCKVFLPRHRIHGVNKVERYKTNGSLPPDLRMDIDEFRRAVVADQGGISELTAIRGGLVRLLCDAEAGRLLLMQEIAAKGVGSKPGRAAYDRLLGTMAVWARLAGQLGLDRRAKPALTPQEYWQRRQSQQEPP